MVIVDHVILEAYTLQVCREVNEYERVLVGQSELMGWKNVIAP